MGPNIINTVEDFQIEGNAQKHLILLSGNERLNQLLKIIRRLWILRSEHGGKILADVGTNIMLRIQPKTIIIPKKLYSITATPYKSR